MSNPEQYSSYTTSSSSYSLSLYSVPPPHRCPIPDSVGRALERFLGRVASRCGYGPYAVSERIMKMPLEVLWEHDEASNITGSSKKSEKAVNAKKLDNKLKEECHKIIQYTYHEAIATQIQALTHIAILASLYPAARERFVAYRAHPMVKRLPSVLVNRGAHIDDIDSIRPHVQWALDSMGNNKVYGLQQRIVADAGSKSSQQRSALLREMVGLLRDEDDELVARWVIMSCMNRFSDTAWDKAVLAELFTELGELRESETRREARSLYTDLDVLSAEALHALSGEKEDNPLSAVTFVKSLQSAESMKRSPQAAHQAKRLWELWHPEVKTEHQSTRRASILFRRK